MSTLDDITIVKHKKEVEYTTLYNDCINDERLTAECLAILVYVMSKPDNFKIIIKNISNRFKIGRDKTYFKIKDLISLGYMKRVRIRKKDGTLSRTVIYASDKPIFLKCLPSNEITKINKTPHTEIQEMVKYKKTNKQPHPENPDMVNQDVVPYIQNKDNYKETTTTNLGIANTNHEVSIQGCSVVVSLMNKIRNIPNFDISDEQMSNWIDEYGSLYVDEKIELMKAQKKVASLGGYLRTALKHNWKNSVNASLPENSLREEINIQEISESTSTNELYDQTWFDSLSENSKQRIFDNARTAWPIIGEVLELSKINIYDADFSKSPWFKPMIDAYRSYNRK